MKYAPFSDIVICPGNCSDRGDCFSGKCFCQVQFTGGACDQHNVGYFLGFGVFFYGVSLMTLIQLILCIRAECMKMEKPNILSACKLTIQKSIYIIVIFAAGVRATYFVGQLAGFLSFSWTENLFLTFYPFVMSALALIVCFWAESFHLSNVQSPQAPYLTKSYGGYVAFNVILFLLLFGQIALSHLLPWYSTTNFSELLNIGFTIIMVGLLTVYLIYGIEIFCKVKGEFAKPSVKGNKILVNIHQLFQSRIGLVSQATFQLAVTGFFFLSEVFSKFWGIDATIGEKNIINISFHLAELGITLWFPCCFWNVAQPSELWIQNPKKLLMDGKVQENQSLVKNEDDETQHSYNTFEEETHGEQEVSCDDEDSVEKECWICYDNEKEEELIEPCDCRGGTSVVHHECLKQWLLERPNAMSNDDAIKCSICKAKYNVTNEIKLIFQPNSKQSKSCVKIFGVVATMIFLPVIIYFIWEEVHQPIVRVSSILLVVLGETFFIRLLGFNFIEAYNIAKTRALKIISKKVHTSVPSNRSIPDASIAVIVH